MAELEGKVAIVTGAASGMGRATAELFAAEGARVIVADLSDRCHGVATSIGHDAMAMVHDVASPESWSTVVAKTLERFGRIDILINNAGIHHRGSIFETSTEDMRRLFEVNALSVMLGMQAVTEPMKAAKQGAIVNNASMVAKRFIRGQFAYIASKWMVRGMSGSAAAELGPLGIRVNSIYPGMIDTPMIAVDGPHSQQYKAMIPLGRMGSPPEVARLMLFLASDSSSYLNGAEVAIDAGLSL